jgi:hypothetical protein
MGEQRSMDDSRWEPGMPPLDRQPTAQARPRTVPELQPTPLQPYYVYLSVVGLICGAVAITALELGISLGSPIVKLCVLIGGPALILATADASLRIWRSARAWMPVDPALAWFRVTWLVPAFVLLAAIVVIGSLVLQA